MVEMAGLCPLYYEHVMLEDVFVAGKQNGKPSFSRQI